MCLWCVELGLTDDLVVVVVSVVMVVRMWWRSWLSRWRWDAAWSVAVTSGGGCDRGLMVVLVAVVWVLGRIRPGRE